MKILIVGIGGVGGFFGGKLAYQYRDSSDLEIFFLARGAHLNQIQKKGLQIKHLGETYTCQPDKSSDDPGEFGKVDVIIYCTKAYGLESIASQLEANMHSGTKVLTLLNGVDSYEKLVEMYPGHNVINGCVYILSRIESPGVIENFGQKHQLFFGYDHQDISELRPLEELFQAAGINAKLSDSISEITWAKFIFISAVATSTSYYNITLGEILADENKRKVLVQLIREVKEVGLKKQVTIADDIEADILNKLEKLPFETTSSMQRDFRQHKQTEVQSLTEYVIQEGENLRVVTPTYIELYKDLITRTRY